MLRAKSSRIILFFTMEIFPNKEHPHYTNESMELLLLLLMMSSLFAMLILTRAEVRNDVKKDNTTQ